MIKHENIALREWPIHFDINNSPTVKYIIALEWNPRLMPDCAVCTICTVQEATCDIFSVLPCLLIVATTPFSFCLNEVSSV